MTLPELASFLASYRGGISVEEGLGLSEYAERCLNGVIVEIGSFKGKSAVALASGQSRSHFAESGMVYCVEPHLPFTGIYGGVFGPQDRRDFYAIMLETGFVERVCLINLKSHAAAKGWAQPIGLLFIDGDHTPEGVRSDICAWERHVAIGGTVIFDYAFDTEAGAYHAIKGLLQSKRFEQRKSIGKMIALRKIAPTPVSATDGSKCILVACHEIAVAGGLYRFERFGRVVQRFGHRLEFVALAQSRQNIRETNFPVLSFQEASRSNWDITIVPGAGFPETTISRFAEFKSPCFGLRVQHVLNDQTRKASFLAVNAAFEPNVVVFNNRHWQPGDFTDFQAEAFHFLEGAVDVERLAPVPRRCVSPRPGQFVVAGLANKNARPLIEAVRICGEGVHLLLMGEAADIAERELDLIDNGRLTLAGVLGESELPDFYSKADCVAHTETFAGWANVAAEAMASGVPLICTPHGTAAFAEHEATALVVDNPTPDALAAAIHRLRRDPDLAARLAREARQRIQRFSWTSYSADLLRLMQRPAANYYTWSPDLGLFGKWPEAVRLAGLEAVLAECAAKTVLDLGAGEGAIARRFLDEGAALVHGFEQEASRVRLAGGVCGDPSKARFWEADLSDWRAFEIDHRLHLYEQYNIVLYLGLHHHLPPATRMTTLAGAAMRTSDWLAIRTPAPLFAADGIGDFLTNRGFYLVNEQSDSTAMPLGASYLYRRGT